MDPNLPWKVIRCPLPLGVCAGITGVVVDEYSHEDVARNMMYQVHREDEGVMKGIYYSYDVVKWEGL